MARTFVGFALVVLGVNVTIFSNSTLTAIEHSVCCHIIVTCQLKIDLGLSMRRLSSKTTIKYKLWLSNRHMIKASEIN